MIMKTTQKTSQNAAKAVLRRNFIAINIYIKKKERSHKNNITVHLEELEKEQTKPKVSRRKEIKIKAEIKELENRKTVEKINKTMSSLFKNKTQKLANLELD